MFEEAEDLDHPYFKTKHDSEGVVRNECKRPFRIYRPGLRRRPLEDRLHRQDRRPVLLLQDRSRRCASMLPPWMPMIGIEGGRINIVPVDFVADALDYLAHKKGLDGKCFHLTDPEPHRIGEVLNIFAKAGARAADDDARQREDVRLHPGADPLRPGLARAGQAHDPRGADRPRHPEGRVPVRQLADALRQPRGGEGAQGLGHRGAARSSPTRRSSGTTGSATSIPISSSTARSSGRVKDKVVVVTGASSGIGKATALKLAGGGRQGDPRRARRGEAARDQAGDRRGRRQGAGSTPPTSPTSRRATRWSRAC